MKSSSFASHVPCYMDLCQNPVINRVEASMIDRVLNYANKEYLSTRSRGFVSEDGMKFLALKR